MSKSLPRHREVNIRAWIAQLNGDRADETDIPAYEYVTRARVVLDEVDNAVDVVDWAGHVGLQAEGCS